MHTPGRIEIVCHKGANKQAPENTLAAARLCVAWGIDYVEVDVRASKDGVLYLLHDPTVDRTTDGTGYINELTSAEVDRLDAGSWFSPRFAGERVPRLEPFLRWIKGQAKVFFDVKWVDPQPLIDLVYAVGMERECFFWCEIPAWMLEFRRLAPDLALKVNAKSVAGVIEARERLRANIVEVELGAMSEPIVAACRAHGLKLMINYMGNDPDCFRQVLQWGADMINTDYGDEFAAFLAKEHRP